jgi:catechol 2,3-dioxygenase-like lactoylglutathione lyase family enzyme
MKFLALAPMLHTDDMQRTKAWYASILGFTPLGDDDENWCRLGRDGIAIMFMRNDHLGAPHATGTQYFYVDDVMALWASIKGRCRAEWGPETMPYGMNEFAIKDPNGYILSFGQQVALPREGVMSGSGSLHHEHAKLRESIFRDVDLTRSSFDDVSLRDASFRNVSLANATIRDADLSGVRIEDANYDGMTMDGILVSDLLRVYRSSQGG